jgi:hypothetical protein
MPSNHLMLDVLPNSIRSLATVTLAAACVNGSQFPFKSGVGSLPVAFTG